MKYSIIIVAYGAWDYLDRCLDSLFSTREDESVEVIIVDNTPGKRTLEEWKLLNQADQLHSDGTNYGFAEGCNIGARMAEGEYLVFLNPDTEVFPGWLEGMAKYLRADPKVGAVGPISNFVAGLQRMDFHMQPAETPAETAERAARAMAGRAIESKLLIGFCVMLPRRVWDEVGGMDPAMFLGNDDLDLSWRLRRLGYELVIASDVFVYHAGHKSFETRPGPEVAKLLRESEEALRQKLLAFYEGNPPSAVELWGVDFMNTLPVQPMTLSVCMIVRNEADKVLKVINDIAPFADECVVVDTGSEDDTIDVLMHREPLGFRDMDWENIDVPFCPLRLYRFPWVQDFAAARNFALSRCVGDWVLWLDADVRVPEKAGQLIAAALRNPGPKMHNRKCFLSFQVEDVGADGRVRQRFNQPRLFPRLPGLEWVGRIHESFVPSAMALGLEEVPTDITIRHTGYAEAAVREAKAERNRCIILREPESPAKYWSLGNNLGMVGKWEEALAAYRWALETPWDEPLNPAFRDQLRYIAARALFNLGRIEDMEAYLDGNGHPDAFFMAGRLHESRGDRMRAIEHFRHYLDYTAQPFFWPYDTDAPTLRPAAYAGMLTLMEAEFNDRSRAFAGEYPDLVKVAEA